MLRSIAPVQPKGLRLVRRAAGERALGGKPIFADPYLELVRILTEAAALEHTVMLGYLVAGFSIKDHYAATRGDVTEHVFMRHRMGGQPEEGKLHPHHTLLDVAVEEMQHLSLVNRLLGQLGAAPNLAPHTVPFTADIYPFPIELEALNLTQVARFLWLEADPTALDPSRHPPGPDRDFIERVLKLLGPDAPPAQEHLGSVYRAMLVQFARLEEQGSPFLPKEFPFGQWRDRLRAILHQGEFAHFAFFRDVFTGAAFGGGPGIWIPGPDYPALTLRGGTAFPGYADTIAPEPARRLAWLTDLHYWLLLALLDVGYRSESRVQRYMAIDVMTQCLWHCGLHLAQSFGVAAPFDRLRDSYGLGRDPASSIHIAGLLAKETLQQALALKKEGILPLRYDIPAIEQLVQRLTRGDLVAVPDV
jgi:hypothetical protein